jgi:hypothetical protein
MDSGLIRVACLGLVALVLLVIVLRIIWVDKHG